MQETIRIPIRAHYRIIDGEVVKESAEYADIPVDTIAEMLIRAFGGVPVLINEEGGGEATCID